MMSLKEVQSVAAALGNQLDAGVPMLQACERMARFQPKYAEFWNETSMGVAIGRPVSEFLERQWPEAFLSAVKAGEESGSLVAVLERIEKIIELQLEMRKLVAGLYYPIGFGLMGLVVFVFFMVQVIPALSTSLGVGQRGMVFTLSAWMSSMFEQHWVVILAGIAGTIIAGIYWFSVPDNRQTALNIVLNVPVVGDSLKYILFGVWANYMALVDSAGIPVTQGLLMTSKTLPTSLRDGLEKLSSEAVSRGLGDAADPEKQLPGDSRRAWPFYISNAFLIAEQTGKLNEALERAAKGMLKDGQARLKIAVGVANLVALFVSALFIVGPVAAYYMQLGIALADSMKG
jgi:type II secretory pathway component PulF